MALEARLRELDSRHRKLDRTIEEELTHPATDELRIQELKRRKLRLKEQIDSLKARSH
ncbi:MAG: DUF465 domain-containing protein [Caulobacter sp.]|nr:DUF465 domain-containing protein [Caulobacter sp.]